LFFFALLLVSAYFVLPVGADHAYISFGNYIIKLTVTDSDCLIDDEIASVHVSRIL
jgi:hypothetical protein